MTDLLPLVPIKWGNDGKVMVCPALARGAVAAGWEIHPSALHPGETVTDYLDRIDRAYGRS